MASGIVESLNGKNGFSYQLKPFFIISMISSDKIFETYSFAMIRKFRQVSMNDFSEDDRELRDAGCAHRHLVPILIR